MSGRVLTHDEQMAVIFQLQRDMRAIDADLLELNREISNKFLMRIHTQMLLQEATLAHAKNSTKGLSK